MIPDPRIRWNGPFPYAALAPAGVTPDTTHDAMQEVSFELMSRGLMRPETQQAWEELRRPAKRLVVDLMLYDIDLAAEVAAARREIAAPDATRPPPLRGEAPGGPTAHAEPGPDEEAALVPEPNLAGWEHRIAFDT